MAWRKACSAAARHLALPETGDEVAGVEGVGPVQHLQGPLEVRFRIRGARQHGPLLEAGAQVDPGGQGLGLHGRGPLVGGDGSVQVRPGIQTLLDLVFGPGLMEEAQVVLHRVVALLGCQGLQGSEPLVQLLRGIQVPVEALVAPLVVGLAQSRPGVGPGGPGRLGLQGRGDGLLDQGVRVLAAAGQHIRVLTQQGRLEDKGGRVVRLGLEGQLHRRQAPLEGGLYLTLAVLLHGQGVQLQLRQGRVDRGGAAPAGGGEGQVLAAGLEVSLGLLGLSLVPPGPGPGL